MKLLTLFFLLLLMFLYACLGGVVFHYLERGNEQQVIKEFNDTLYFYIQQRPCFNYSDIFMLEELLKQLDRGGLYMGSTGNLTYSSTWELRSAIYVSAELFVGIGHTNFMPVTTGGLIFTNLYVLVSIFFEFTVIYFVGKLLNLLIDAIWNKFDDTFMRRHKSLDKLFRQLFLASVGSVFFLLIPAVIISSLEKWNFGESIYFVLTSLFGVGFGDFQTAVNHNVGLSDDFLMWYRLAVAFWLILMIMWFGSIILNMNDAIGHFIWTNTEDVVDDVSKKLKERLPKMKKKNPSGGKLEKKQDFESTDDVRYGNTTSSGEVSVLQLNR